MAEVLGNLLMVEPVYDGNRDWATNPRLEEPSEKNVEKLFDTTHH